MAKQVQVELANPYRACALGSLGNADRMLVRQFKFPASYNEDLDRMLSLRHDPTSCQDYLKASGCFKKHTGANEMCFEQWAKESSNDEIFKFLEDILNADNSIKWTGYRILGTVNKANGFLIWTLELFSKHPGS
jgi:hypothetical protein